MSDANALLREQLVGLLRGGNAHMTYDEAVANFPIEAANQMPPNVPYTPWHLLEHLRLAQRDILEFSRDPNYISPPWPEGYWPAKDAQADAAKWQSTISSFQADLDSLASMVQNPFTDLTADLPWALGYTILREILVVSDHNAYHTGEFAILRQVMGTWPAGH